MIVYIAVSFQLSALSIQFKLSRNPFGGVTVNRVAIAQNTLEILDSDLLGCDRPFYNRFKMVLFSVLDTTPAQKTIYVFQNRF
jgi:hypothetical protein